MNVYEQTIIIRGKRKCVNPLAAAAETPNEQCIGMSKRIFRYIARLRYPESGIPHPPPSQVHPSGLAYVI